jgi:hypothetical protein
MTKTESSICQIPGMCADLETKVETAPPVETAKNVPGAEMPTEYEGYKGYAMSNSVGALIVWFLVIFVVVILALYSLKPTFCLKKSTIEVDNGKVIISAFVIALLVVLLIWLVQALVRRKC